MIKNKITDLDIKNVYLNGGIDWEIFRNKTIYITGATGVIGSFIIRCLRHANKHSELNLKIVAAVRNPQAAMKFFNKKDSNNFIFYKNDVMNPIKYRGHVDYIIHAASNTSSASFVEKPVETFNVAVKGTENVLNFAKEKNVKSMVYLSSMEVYGNVNEPRLLKESDLGDLDLTEARSSYPMGKRAAENLCYSCAKEYNIPVKVARLAQVIGANVDYNDSRVYAQFARSIVEKQDIILNTKAETTRSYCYISDIVTGLLTTLIKGENGECYNIANEESSYRICDIAKALCAKYTSSKLIFDIKDSTPYFKETHWVLDNNKLKSLDWSAQVTLKEAYEKLISSFYYQKNKSKRFIKKIKIKGKKFRITDKYTLAEQIFSVKNRGNNKVVRLLWMDILKIDLRERYLKVFCKEPIQRNKIVFANFEGNGYGCNPKYIAECIIKNNLPYELVWLAKPSIDRNSFPPEIRVINWNSQQALKELATAKFWIDNQRKIKHIKKGLIKREEQIYIQTWHGSLGIKKLDADVTNFNTPDKKEWLNVAKYDSQMTNYLISNSTFESNILPKALWFKNKVIEIGHPRNDIFFKKEDELQDIKNRVYSKLKIDLSKKTFLYMPSFRDDFRLDCYALDVENLKSILEEKFGGSWNILIRMHPRVEEFSHSLFTYDENIINASSYPDIQELLVSVDMAMTDYSSCIFDFMLSRKPAFIFATDIELFNTERGFYYPLEATPFPVATDNIELIRNIRNFDLEQYKQKVEMFLNEKGCMEDGKAGEQVVNLIEQVME